MVGHDDTGVEVCTFLTSFFLSMLTTKLTKYYAPLVMKYKRLTNTILSEGKIIGASMPTEKQGLCSSPALPAVTSYAH